MFPVKLFSSEFTMQSLAVLTNEFTVSGCLRGKLIGIQQYSLEIQKQGHIFSLLHDSSIAPTCSKNI